MEDYNLSPDEVEEMLKTAQNHAEEDRILREKVDLKNQLENRMHQSRSAAEDEKVNLSEDDKETIIEMCDEIDEWLSTETDSQHIGDLDLEDLKEKLQEFSEAVDPILGAAQHGAHDDVYDE